MEWVFFILIFGGVIVVTAVLFGAWVIITVAKLVLHGVGFIMRGGSNVAAPRAVVRNTRTCPHPDCLAANPSDANFCRRCGRAMPAMQRVSVRRAAMW